MVNKLSPATTSRSLHDAFQRFGVITDARVIMNPSTNSSKGYGFVRFSTSDEARLAVEAMNGTSVDGHTISVHFAKDKPTDVVPPAQPHWAQLYVAGFINNSLEEIVAAFGAFGSVMAIKEVPSQPNMKKVCFLDFQTMTEAQEALNAMNGATVKGDTLSVRFSNKTKLDYGAAMNALDLSTGLYSIFVYGVPHHADESWLWGLFSQYGDVAETNVVKDRMGQPKGFGFVKMANVVQATTAVHALNGAHPQDCVKPLQVKFKTNAAE